MTTGAPPSAPLLVVDGASKTFRRSRATPVAAVTGASFEMRAGEAVALVGRSGAGKSTLARIIAGLETPDDGQVVFDGQDLAPLRGRARRRLQASLHLLFQDPYASLAPGMSVQELVAEPLRIHRRGSKATRGATALAALERVQLCPARRYAERYPAELSGGERQRVAIARALVLRPKLIIADEPTQMLDTGLRADVLDLLARLRVEQGMAQLLITHDLAAARQVCDRILVMEGGSIVEEGPAEAICRSPQHRRTAALVDAADRLHEALTRMSP